MANRLMSLMLDSETVQSLLSLQTQQLAAKDDEIVALHARIDALEVSSRTSDNPFLPIL
jgi:hypothetical protein